jgi:hypothetical protein
VAAVSKRSDPCTLRALQSTEAGSRASYLELVCSLLVDLREDMPISVVGEGDAGMTGSSRDLTGIDTSLGEKCKGPKSMGVDVQ